MCLSVAIANPQNVLATGEHLGFQWQVVHNWFGVRCGYVRVPLGHPWHGQNLNLDVEVHGGVSFAEADVDRGNPEDNAWWIGFDCGHCWDAPDISLLTSPEALSIYNCLNNGIVRSQEYVENECKNLCEQAYNAIMRSRILGAEWIKSKN
jgi:hypothetical protein